MIGGIALAAVALPQAAANEPKASKPRGKAIASEPAGDSPAQASVPSAEQQKQIASLIEQLVFAEQKASDDPLIDPDFADQDDAYRKRFDRCRNAFKKLSELKDVAFPLLIAHLDDDRQSIPFRNHSSGQSMGDACYWIIHDQLQDRPDDYSSYGYDRKGRDGEFHTQPYWDGSPFEDAGGLVKWLEENRELTYTQKQIKCLQWLLDSETKIGAPDAESYFENILPLEIRIVERRLEAGEDTRRELQRLRLIRDEKRVAEIPARYLPD
jgi:hypothetical protein